MDGKAKNVYNVAFANSFSDRGWVHWHLVRGLAPSYKGTYYQGPAILTKDDQPPSSSSWLSVEEGNSAISSKEATGKKG